MFTEVLIPHKHSSSASLGKASHRCNSGHIGDFLTCKHLVRSLVVKQRDTSADFEGFCQSGAFTSGFQLLDVTWLNAILTGVVTLPTGIIICLLTLQFAVYDLIYPVT